MEVFLAFLKLGVSAFGGPVAHLGYFRTEFVERRRWLDDEEYTELVALCQFLPGPASSQVGIALGFGRAGWSGALAAWLGFTLPSAIAMILFALGTARAAAGLAGPVHGLKIAAVAVVAQAVWNMGRSLCPDARRRILAAAAALIALALPGMPGQLTAISLGALAGWWLLPQIGGASPTRIPRGHVIQRRTGALLLGLFALLLVGLPIWAAASGSLLAQALAVFYRSGALVFGGGHVVLPLLQAGVVAPGWIGTDTFLAGYGAAQAMPGPLFTLAAFLGAAMPAPLGGWAGGLLMLAAIFLPAFLLVAGALPFWHALRGHGAARSAMAGVNAAVVGLLAAALYQPVWTGAIHAPADAAVALAALAFLMSRRVPVLLVVAFAALAGTLLA